MAVQWWSDGDGKSIGGGGWRPMVAAEEDRWVARQGTVLGFLGFCFF